ncbi:MAG: hypothetical protein ABJN26_13400 [Stappiaceae bacterium]
MPEKSNQSLLTTSRLLFKNFIGTGTDDEIGTAFRTTWRRRTIGFLLLFMYGVVFYVVMMSLTAYQIQTRVQALGDTSNKWSIWSVTRTADRIFKTQSSIDEQAKAIHQLNSNAVEFQSKLIAANRESSAALSELKNILQVENPDISLQSKFSALEAFSEREVFDIVKAHTAKLSDTAKSALDLLKQALDMQETLRLELSNADLKKEHAQKNLESLEKQKSEFLASTRNHDKIVELTDELHFFYYPPDYSNNSLFGGAYVFMFGGTVKAGEDQTDKNTSTYGFVTLPSEVLMMLIVIAMGTMGSLINITQIFFSGEDRKTSFFLFRPLLGAVVAIAIYVLTKAGVLVASNPTATSGDPAQLNAFFVSFVSLISGLMSETAINTIKNSGTRFFRGDVVTEKSRYANNVLAVMKAQDKSNSDLYPFFDVPQKEIDGWLSETELVPGDAQRIIGAWLGTPVRDLFSDIEPPTNKKPEEEAD